MESAYKISGYSPIGFVFQEFQKMAFNYRMVRENGHITIRDVYYDDAGNITSWATGPSYPWGDCIKDLSTDLARYGAALKLPVLFEEGGALVEEYSED